MSPTSTRPPFLILRLTSPRQENATVAWLQALINARSPKYVQPPLPVDGVFGAWTAHESEEMLYRLGHPSPTPAVGVEALQVLWIWSQGAALPGDWQMRRLARMAIGFKPGWGIALRSWRGLHPAHFPPAPAGQAFSPSAATDVMLGWERSDWKESPAGSNVVPPMADLAEDRDVRDDVDEMGYAWCQFAAYLAALLAGGRTAYAGLVEAKFWPLYTPFTLVFGQRREWGHVLIPPHLAKRGDMVLFNFGSSETVQHVGRLLEPPGQQVVSVDGNTSSSSQDNGGTVMVRSRSSATAVGYVRDQ